MIRFSAIALLAFALPTVTPGQSKTDVLAGGNPAIARMGSDLLMARQAVRSGAAPMAAIQSHCPGAVREGKLQVIIAGDDLASITSACEDAGLEIVGRFDNFGLRNVTVRCNSPQQLDALTGLAGLRSIIAEPAVMTRAGSVPAQADPSMGTDDARSVFGVDGSGVRVGVLSDSIVDTRLGGGSLIGGILTGSTDQVSGDLPSSVRVVDAGPGGGTDEGNGMAQLISDVAPGCDISFASAFTGYFQFATNILALATDPGMECDVIVDDVGYFAEPLYQDGPIALAADTVATTHGVPYFSSAGNNANFGYQAPYADPYASSELVFYPATGADMHDFDPGPGVDQFLTFQLSAGDFVTVTLQWTQPYGGALAAGAGSESDFDLFVVQDPPSFPLINSNPSPGAVNGPDNVYAVSASAQGIGGAPAGDPFEVLQFVAPTSGLYHVAVDHWDGVKTDTININFNAYTTVYTDIGYTSGGAGGSTIFGHPMARDAFAVAAVYHCDVDFGGGITPTAAIDPEPFTSDGVFNATDFASLHTDTVGMPIFFDATGAALATPEYRDKPEITAPDGINTTFFGSSSPNLGGICGEPDGIPNFFGTSAAAPNAAAVAALMIQEARDNGLGTPSPAVIYEGLMDNAIDMVSTTQRAPAGPDNRTGAGRILASNAAGTFGAVQATGIPVELSVFSAD